MKKFLSIIFASTISTSLIAQTDNYGHLKFGVQASAGLGTKRNNSSININSFNGYNILPYFQFNKRAMVLRANLGYSQHFHSAQLKNSIQGSVHQKVQFNNVSFVHEYHMGFLINRRYKTHVELGFGWQFAHDFGNQTKVNIEYTKIYDPELGADNNIPTYVTKIIDHDDVRVGFLLYAQLNHNADKFPFFVRFTLNNFVSNAEYKIGLSAFSPTQNRKVLYNTTGFSANAQLLFTFGINLFDHSKANKKLE